MRKPEIADADMMCIAIQQEAQSLDESRYDHRLHGLLLVTSGQSCRQVARLFDENPQPGTVLTAAGLPSRLQATPIRWIGSPRSRYLSA